MKMMKKRSIVKNITMACGVLLLAISLTSCKKMVEVPKPANEILIADAFTDSASATGAVTGIYAGMIMNEVFEWGGLTLNTSVGADELNAAAITAFEKNALGSTDPLIAKMWAAPYNTLLIVNTAMEGLIQSSTLSSIARNQLLGECYVDRAFLNFQLVNLWGSAAPLVITSSFVNNTALPSSSTEALYAQIISDLKQAQAMLRNDYPSPNRARPNLMAANALLARTYLYTEAYDKAITEATKVIESGIYTLPAPENAFIQGSNETIWSIQPNLSAIPGVSPDGNLYVPFFDFMTPGYTLSPGLVAAFETGDQRKEYWTNTVTIQDMAYTYPYKYKKNYFNTAEAENYVVLRLAEQYLIRAEAYCKLGNITNAVADLNTVRARAGLPGLQATSLNEVSCMAAVEQERRMELFVEWGHRWYDLKRWPATDGSKSTRADQVLSVLKTTWQPFQKLYPVPIDQFRYDANLIQNPGY